MSKTVKVQITLREDSSNVWEKLNPILKKAEFGYESNTGKLKIGDGVTAWNSLSYLIGERVPEGAIFTDTVVNLSNYYTKSEVESLINEKLANATISAVFKDGNLAINNFSYDDSPKNFNIE